MKFFTQKTACFPIELRSHDHYESSIYEKEKRLREYRQRTQISTMNTLIRELCFTKVFFISVLTHFLLLIYLTELVP